METLKTPDMLQYEYAREALKNGLKLERTLGANPYRFGMVGSTDSHTALPTAKENNFFGKFPNVEPMAGRMIPPAADMEEPVMWQARELGASGYAAVWATENTRAAIWDAMQRREVYATTGPRMTVRFFGGWDFSADDANWADSIGDAELVGFWRDPEFDASQPAVYYARAIEIPTPRWTAYDARYFGDEPVDGTTMILQERAYTSPIWYRPADD